MENLCKKSIPYRKPYEIEDIKKKNNSPVWRKHERKKTENRTLEGLVVDQGVIWDSHGNRYTESDVRNSWRCTELVNETHGSKNKILVLKKELEERIQMNRVPKICLIWESDKEVIERVFELTEI
jgi:hypothetical protein